MNEQSRPSDERQTGPGGLGSIFDESGDVAGRVTVASGPFAESLPAANMTVGEIRTRFGPRLDIDDRAQAVLDGHDASNDTVVRQGQMLMFTHRAGEKGVTAAAFPHPLAEKVAESEKTARGELQGPLRLLSRPIRWMAESARRPSSGLRSDPTRLLHWRTSRSAHWQSENKTGSRRS